jgi:hypothetical protein
MIDEFSAKLRATLSAVSQDWRERPSKEGIRAFALVNRNQISEFRKIMLNTSVPREFTVRVSGPWPVSEFIEQS